MSSEAWLRPNRRPALLLTGLGSLVAVAAFLVIMLAIPWETSAQRWLVAIAVSALGGAVLATSVGCFRATRARVYRRGSQLFFRLGTRPIGVPLHVVEAFFLGQGPAHLPGGIGGRREAVNLVARLSQRATEWRRRDVNPRVAAWSEGYITIRGTHCEPLRTDTIRRLNRLLAAAQHETRKDD